jgi:hypothetical protein
VSFAQMRKSLEIPETSTESLNRMSSDDVNKNSVDHDSKTPGVLLPPPPTVTHHQSMDLTVRLSIKTRFRIMYLTVVL